MPLADNIHALGDRCKQELIAAHDYFANSKAAWQLVEDAISRGGSFSTRNPTTGSSTGPAELAPLISRYVAKELIEATFQQFISIFESYFFDFLRLWLTAYPQSLFGRTVDFREIFEVPDMEAVTLLVVNKKINEILYERPIRWFEYLDERVKLGCPTNDEIERFAEAKASRDVLTHNRGIVGKTYLAKAGKLARFKLGDRLDLPENYHREVWEFLRKMVDDITLAAVAKSPCTEVNSLFS